jgi:hypothetical protein
MEYILQCLEGHFKILYYFLCIVSILITYNKKLFNIVLKKERYIVMCKNIDKDFQNNRLITKKCKKYKKLD